MNKKGLSAVAVMLTNILLVLIAVGIVYIVIDDIIEKRFGEEFKITNEVCEISITQNDLIRYAKDLALLNSYRLDFIEATNEKDKMKAKFYAEDSELIMNIKGRYETEVCKQEEVEEITKKIINPEWVDECTISLPNTTMRVSIVGGEAISEFTVNSKTIQNCDTLIPQFLEKKVSKQDLTTKWLEKNCNGYLCNANELKDCISYKCQDYLVEVIK